MKAYKTMAHINSLQGKMAEITVLKEFTEKNITRNIVDSNGTKCKAILNVFNGHIYADDCYEIINKELKVGNKIKIIEMYNEPQYTNKIGVVTFIDDAKQVHGTWGGCAIIPEKDLYEIIED